MKFQFIKLYNKAKNEYFWLRADQIKAIHNYDSEEHGTYLSLIGTTGILVSETPRQIWELMCNPKAMEFE